MNLIGAKIGKEYRVERINIEDEELTSFLFSLGCYEGEVITVISRNHSGSIVAIKDARYSIDSALSAAISVTD